MQAGECASKNNNNSFRNRFGMRSCPARSVLCHFPGGTRVADDASLFRPTAYTNLDEIDSLRDSHLAEL